MMNRAVTSMNEEIVKQQKRVDEASAEVGRIRDEEHIVDLNLEGKEDAETPLNTLVVKQEGR